MLLGNTCISQIDHLINVVEFGTLIHLCVSCQVLVFYKIYVVLKITSRDIFIEWLSVIFGRLAQAWKIHLNLPFCAMVTCRLEEFFQETLHYEPNTA